MNAVKTSGCLEGVLYQIQFTNINTGIKSQEASTF